MPKRRRIDWDSIPDLLTTKPAALARRLKCSQDSVREAQHKRGKPKTQPIDWDSVEDLGEVLDAEIAQRYGICREYVSQVRRKKGIPSAKQFIDWSTVTDLGKVSDGEIAKRVGCHPSAVLLARRKLGISAYKLQRSKYNWDLIPLGEKSDSQISRELGVAISTVNLQRLKRHIPSFAEAREKRLKEVPLGVLMARGGTKKLAKQLGFVGTHSIAKLRASIDPSRINRPLDLNIKRQLIEELATTWDASLAKKYGVSASNICLIRQKEGITKLYTEKRTCPCGKEFTATRHDHIHCSRECNIIVQSLRRWLDVDACEQIDPRIIQITTQLEKKLRPRIKRVRWSQKLDELFNTSVKDLCERYDCNRRHIAQMRRTYRKKEGMTNETPQTQSVDDNPRQPHDPASRRRGKERRDTRSRRSNALPDSASESGTQAG